MQLACPKCGTREIKVSHGYGIAEAFKSLIGIYHLRCRRCRARWETSMWENGAWRYARCPRCYRQELTTWSLQYYNPPSSTMLKLHLGAKRYRCAACRCNFASFKPCRDKKIWRRREPGESVAGTGQFGPPED
jgi:hypothetical protein